MEPTDTNMSERLQRFGRSNPVQFVAVAAFAVMAGIPVATFLAYAIGTLIASLVGALVLEVVLLFGGIMVLGIALFVVVSLTACITAIFASIYYAYRATIYAVDKGKRVRIVRLPTTDITGAAETDPKNKPIELLLSEHASQPDFETTSDFFWTASVTLFLLTSIAVMCAIVVVTGYFVIEFT